MRYLGFHLPAPSASTIPLATRDPAAPNSGHDIGDGAAYDSPRPLSVQGEANLDGDLPMSDITPSRDTVALLDTARRKDASARRQGQFDAAQSSLYVACYNSTLKGQVLKASVRTLTAEVC